MYLDGFTKCIICAYQIMFYKCGKLVFIEVLRPVNPMVSYRARSVYLTILLLSRLSSPSG